MNFLSSIRDMHFVIHFFVFVIILSNEKINQIWNKKSMFQKNFHDFRDFLYCITIVDWFFFVKFKSNTKIICCQLLSSWIFVSILFNFCNYSSLFLKFKFELKFFCCWNSIQNDFNKTFLKNLLTFFLCNRYC